MLHLITEKAAIAIAQQRLQREPQRRASRRGRVVLGFQGGSLPADGMWFEDLDFWFAHRHVPRLGRYWNAFGYGNPFERTALPISVEVNPPFSGISRKVAGAFARDDDGSVSLVHRGNIGGGRKGVGKASFLSAYPDALEPMAEGSGSADVIVVGVLGTDTLAAQIENFVSLVDSIKQQLVGTPAPGRKPATRSSSVADSYTDEFSGTRRYSTKGTVEANVLHGVVVSRLRAELLSLGHEAFRDRARDLYVPGSRGKLRALFEVKTDVSSTSVYTAVGQLMLNGATSRRQIAVLPVEIDKARVNRLSQLGIRTVTFGWKGNVPVFMGLRGALS